MAPSRKSSKRRRGPQPAARPRPPAKAKPPARPADPAPEAEAVDPITIEEADLAAGAPLQDLGTPHPLPPDTSDDTEVDPDPDPDPDLDELEVEPLAVAPADPTRTGDELDADDELLPAARKTRAAPAKVGGNRVAAFLRASWAELQRVQWPDRRQVGQATAVVLGFVVIAGGYLGLVDLVSQKIVDAIL